MKIEITKCYLVQWIDDDGNEQESEYIFANSKKEVIDMIKGKDEENGKD